MTGFPFTGASLKSGTYNDNEYSGYQRLDALRSGTGVDPSLAELINSATTYAFGSGNDFKNKNFPILNLTQGAGKKKAVKSFDLVVKNQIFGKPKTTSVVSKYIETGKTKIGLNHQLFYMIFRDRHFQKNQIISTNGIVGNIKVQIWGHPKRISEGQWRYEARVFGKSTDFIPARFLRQGTTWAEGVMKVSQEHSRGTENRSYNGINVSNRLSVMRQSINLAGNYANKMLYVKIAVDGRQFQFAYDWEKYLTELTFNCSRETDLLISSDNADSNGFVGNVDYDSGKPVYSGAGLINQIPKVNFLGFTEMSTKKLSTFLTDSLSISGNLDQDLNSSVVIDVMCGYGLLTDISDAMSKNLSLLTPLVDSTLFISKNSDGGLQMGAYFNTYKHISGKIFRFTHHDFFDNSALAQSAPKHPKSGLPITSHEGIIMNFASVSTGNGKTAGNIEFQYEEGREFIDGTVRGMAKIEGMQGGDISTDIDASSMHMMTTQGIHCYNPLSLAYIHCKML